MGKKILVIDDDPVGGALMVSRLSKEGHEVVRAVNGEQGLAKAQEFLPALIILDIEMPEMNGYTFVGEQRKIDSIKDVPVIVLTSHEENKSIFARKNIKNYLIKPVNFDILFSTMNIIFPV
jgi:DNA-binding response OmpR family regulator